MKNFGLFLGSITLSLLLAYPFGYFTRHFFPSGFSSIWFSDFEIYYANGLFFAYLFIVPIIFGIWAQGEKWQKVAIAAVPVLVLSYFVGLSYLVWSAIFFVAGIVVAFVAKQVRRG